MRRLIILASLSFLPGTLSAADIADLTAKAEKGDAEAMYQLGRLHAEGKEVKKDDLEALKWFLKAAAKDHSKAEVQLGSFYAHGFGVKQDWTEAIKWFRKAALKGDTTAQHNLGLDYQHGHGVEKDLEMAASWFKLAAGQGHARAQFNLGELCEKGQGIVKSEDFAYVYYTLASHHPDQVHIFGAAKAKEVIEKRDRIEKTFSPESLKNSNRMVLQIEAQIAIHPRKFGLPNGLGSSRGWYIWRKWDPERSEAEMMHEGTGEIFKTRVFPYATTYRYLNYGSSPDALQPGERINAFFSPGADHKRDFLVHFQDEICQMKGHGHFWQIKSVAKDAASCTAVAMAGDKALDGKELAFRIDPKCKTWRAGQVDEKFPFGVADKIYLTWCLEKDQRNVMLASDDASLEAIKQMEAVRLQKVIDRDGVNGHVESWDGEKLHVMIYARHWAQAGRLNDQQAVLLKRNDQTIEGKIVFCKNRGTYGSGVTDMLIEPAKPVDANRIRAWVIQAGEIRVVERR